ncbi:hypothetical protein [Variovorax sp. IB41]|uniref:hypothetical protein n=1 Tax=Variovorax sp. IB41 TaxID=2779370 RepID=UPI0018E7D517|nr:hypothetical protein [Variovorax sp. IB41]MBJ2158052.1 hypothetical protein [Variovorax sp. IB41]
MTQKARRTSTATIPRRTHLFCLSEAKSIAGVCRKHAAKQKQESPATRLNASLPGLMAGLTPKPSIRATGSQWFLPCWQQEIAAVDPPSIEPLTCTSDCLTLENA